MFGWISRAEMFASSTNMRTNSACPDRRGWMRLTTNGRANAAGPSPTAWNTSAIPPLPIFSVSRYFICATPRERRVREFAATWPPLNPLQGVDNVLVHHQALGARPCQGAFEPRLEFRERHREGARVHDDDHREVIGDQRLRDVHDVAACVRDCLGDLRDDAALVLARRRHHRTPAAPGVIGMGRRLGAAVRARRHLARHLGDDAAQVRVLHRAISTRSTTATTAASIGTIGLLPGGNFSLTATRAACPNATMTSSPGPASSVSAQTTRSSVGSDAAPPPAPAVATPGGRSPSRYGRTRSNFNPLASGHLTVDQTVPATRPRNIGQPAPSTIAAMAASHSRSRLSGPGRSTLRAPEPNATVTSSPARASSVSLATTRRPVAWPSASRAATSNSVCPSSPRALRAAHTCPITVPRIIFATLRPQRARA